MRRHKSACYAHIWMRLVVAVGLVVATGFAVRSGLAKDDTDDDALLKDAQGLFKPLPKDMATAEFPITSERVSLGRKLFFDPRISVDGTVSCSRCHLPGALRDGRIADVARGARPGRPRNAPTVLNAGIYFKQHWDGVFANVEEQAKKALLGPAFGVRATRLRWPA